MDSPMDKIHARVDAAREHSDFWAPVGTGREMRAHHSRRAADEEHYNATHRSGT